MKTKAILAMFAASLSVAGSASADQGGSQAIPSGGVSIPQLAYLCDQYDCPDIQAPYVQFTVSGQWYGGSITVNDNTEGNGYSSGGDGYSGWVTVSCTDGSNPLASGNASQQTFAAYCNWFAGAQATQVTWDLQPDCPPGLSCY
jgi:hypothetical protein